jgi:myosin heavy subunit
MVTMGACASFSRALGVSQILVLQHYIALCPFVMLERHESNDRHSNHHDDSDDHDSDDPDSSHESNDRDSKAMCGICNATNLLVPIQCAHKLCLECAMRNGYSEPLDRIEENATPKSFQCPMCTAQNDERDERAKELSKAEQSLEDAKKRIQSLEDALKTNNDEKDAMKTVNEEQTMELREKKEELANLEKSLEKEDAQYSKLRDALCGEGADDMSIGCHGDHSVALGGIWQPPPPDSPSGINAFP